MKDVAIIIVSYNVRELLDDCLASVYASRGVSFDVCVVDNASRDGSAALVHECYPQVDLIESPHNGGYAYANNLGVNRLKAVAEAGETQARAYRYILLLNPDTRLDETALAMAVTFMDGRPEVGIMGPKLLRQDGSLDLACRRSFPTPEVSLYRMIGLSKLFPRSRRFARYNLTFIDPSAEAEVDAVAGAFMLLRQEAVQQAGLLDERFFMYAEDVDWALRIKAQGWKVVYNPAITVLHVKGASSRSNHLKTTFEFYRSMLLFYKKHYARSTFPLLHWLIVAGIYLRGGMAFLQAVLAMPRAGQPHVRGKTRTHSIGRNS